MYKKNMAPDANVVQLKATMGQLRLLNELVYSELSFAEQGEGNYERKPLERLADLLWPHLNIKMTPEAAAAEHEKERACNLAASKAYKETFKRVKAEQEAL